MDLHEEHCATGIIYVNTCEICTGQTGLPGKTLQAAGEAPLVVSGLPGASATPAAVAPHQMQAQGQGGGGRGSSARAAPISAGQGQRKSCVETPDDSDPPAFGFNSAVLDNYRMEELAHIKS